MCNGHSTRISQGGSIAVLRPTSHFVGTRSEDDMFLLFSNQSASLGTSVEFKGLEEHLQQDRHWIVIHRDGDLSATSQSAPADPLCTFPLTSGLDSTMQLPQRLDLGVGNAGIIGRRISVIAGSTQGTLTLAEGIIGWN
ncbi:Nn.00g033630.m01.CDS01 [Neocucurbitaria sp. VM-36]